MNEIILYSALLPISVIAFTIAVVICCIGIFYSHYHENWLQFFGLTGISVASVLKMQEIIELGASTLETAWLAVSLACFALGTLVKVWQHRHDKMKNEPPPSVEPKPAKRKRFHTTNS